MLHLAIRTHPSFPVDAHDLEDWLERQLEELRAAAPRATVRLVRLTQHLPNTAVDIGWLLELDLPDSERIATERQLQELLTDMRLLGFEPTVLLPHELDVTRGGCPHRSLQLVTASEGSSRHAAIADGAVTWSLRRGFRRARSGANPTPIRVPSTIPVGRIPTAARARPGPSGPPSRRGSRRGMTASPT
jgi:hypothetical protein